MTYLNLSTNYLSEYFEIVHRHIFQIYVEKLSGILDTFSNNYYPVSKKAYSQTPKYADLKLLIRALNSLVFIRNRLDNWSTSDWYRNVKLPPFDALILLYKEKKCVQAIIEEFLGELKLNFYPYKGKKDFSYDVINVSNEFLGCVSIAGEIKILLKLICNELRDSILRDVLTQFDEYIMSNCVGLKLLDDKAAHEQIRRDILAFWKMFNVSGDDMPKLNNRVMRNRL